MIVCHCNHIEHTDIERAANDLAARDRWQIITPISVYKALGKRPRCGGCMPLAANIIHTRQTCEIALRGDCPLADLADDTAFASNDGKSSAIAVMEPADV